MRNTLIPVLSFLLALLLSMVTSGTPRMAVARQSTGTTGCECRFNIMKQSAELTWGGKGHSLKLAHIAMQASVDVCTSSDPQGQAWSAQWSATNLSVTYVVTVNKEKLPPDTKTIPIPFGTAGGTCPCKPATASGSISSHTHLTAFTKGATETLLSMLAPNYPPGTEIKIDIDEIVISPTLDVTVSGKNGCGGADGPLLMSIETKAGSHTPKGDGSNSKTYLKACP